jgi:hypothetical protein
MLVNYDAPMNIMDIALVEDLSIGSEVITETGVLLGWLKKVGIEKVGIEDDTSSANRVFLVLSGSPFLWIPEVVSGAYELPIEEIISPGHNRLIVFEGAEERIEVLTVGVLERLGISKVPREYSPEAYRPPVCSWNDENDNGFSPATIPRRPSPKPTGGEAEIPMA